MYQNTGGAVNSSAVIAALSGQAIGVSRITVTGGTITASAPNDISQTWNNAGVTFKARTLSITDTASAAGSLVDEITVGGSTVFRVDKLGNISASSLYNVSGTIGLDCGLSTAVRLWANGAFKGALTSTGFVVASDYCIGFSSTTAATGSVDLSLFRDGGSDVLAQRRGTNNQIFRIYNTFTDLSNYERGSIRWASNVFRVGPENAGTGSARQARYDFTGTGNGYIEGTNVDGSFRIVSAAVEFLSVSFGSTGLNYYNYYWNGSAIPWTFGPDNAGATNRQGDSYVFRLRGGSGNATPSYFGWGCAFAVASGTTRHTQEDALLLRLLGSGQTQLAFGASFASSAPSLKRSGTTIQFRLADDSADSPITVSTVRTVPVTVANLPAAATAGSGARAMVTDANATHSAGLGNIVAGGGANIVPVYSDGTNWRIG